MRRALAVLVLVIAGFAPLLRYHPGSGAEPATGVAAGPAPAPTGSANARAPAGSRTVNGSVVDTGYGPYQVQVTITGTAITDVRLITQPDDGHSRRIANRAAPTLRSEALQAQNAHIDTVSGATATSEAYAQSLQAALDAEGN
ncbi:FMN-binding protein [Nocardia miyunensis]|uniref:FMN-binding protein n=1 Tax=Nocardia miyunensis TaxID=282684 RepID=UPI00082F5A5D|nr:FMN-binding protein [Nocardia miyunensis]